MRTYTTIHNHIYTHIYNAISIIIVLLIIVYSLMVYLYLMHTVCIAQCVHTMYYVTNPTTPIPLKVISVSVRNEQNVLKIRERS